MEEKGAGPNCVKHPSGRCGKLAPFFPTWAASGPHVSGRVGRHVIC